MKLINLILLLAPGVFAFPADVSSPKTGLKTADNSKGHESVWEQGLVQDFTIHASCNHSQHNQIYAGLQETKVLSQHAKDHVLQHGRDSEFFTKYFGNSSSAEVVGWYELIVNSDKSGIIFRCDNPDGNCANEGWAGHWRGDNGTDQTVICDLSYTTRQYLSQMCSQGYTVAESENTQYWASDLLHRIWHTSAGQGSVSHYADSYDDCLTLAETSPDKSVRNSDTLMYFALDVYAYDVALPGIGCTVSDADTVSA